MDLMMPGMDGTVATREIKKKYPQVKVIVLTSFAEQNMVQGALQAGTIGYLQKNVSAKELVSAIRAACEGKMTISPEATQILANSVAQPRRSRQTGDRTKAGATPRRLTCTCAWRKCRHLPQI